MRLSGFGVPKKAIEGLLGKVVLCSKAKLEDGVCVSILTIPVFCFSESRSSHLQNGQ